MLFQVVKGIYDKTGDPFGIFEGSDLVYRLPTHLVNNKQKTE